jgi:hypothetical protein
VIKKDFQSKINLNLLQHKKNILHALCIKDLEKFEIHRAIQNQEDEKL